MKKAPKKRKGYVHGTDKDGVQELDAEGRPIVSGNTLPLTSGTQFQTSGNFSNMSAISEIPKSEIQQTQKLDKKGNPINNNGKSGKNNAMGKAVVQGLGDFGSAYHTSQIGKERVGETGQEGSDMWNQGMAVVSKMGPVGAIIGGAAGMAEAIGKPSKEKANKMNKTTGQYENKDSALLRNTATSFLSPTRELSSAFSDPNTSGGEKAGKFALASIGLGFLNQKSRLDKMEKVKQDEIERVELEKKNLADNEAKDLALAARERGETGYSTASAYRRDSAIDQKKEETGLNKFMSKIGFAKGGEVVGKGTGTSDSIEAEVEEGSFVVPAKHAHMGKMIKEALLKKKTGKANLHQKDGVPVKLSDGEILFTPEEKEEIESEMGEEMLEALAPEAEENEEGKAKGGELSAAKARKILHDKEVNGKPLTDKQRRYMGWVAGGKKMATGGEVDDDYAKKELAKLEAEKKNVAKLASEKALINKKISAQKEEERQIAKNIEQKKKYQKAFADDFKAKENKYKALKDSYETFLKQSESALKQPKQYGLPKLVTPEGERKKKENLLKLLSEAESDYNKSKKIYEGSKNDANWNSDGSAKSGNLPKASSLSNIGKKATTSIKTPTTSFSTPTVKTEAQLSGNKPKSDANQAWVESLKFKPKTITEEELNQDVANIYNPNANAIDTVPVTKTEIDKPFLDSVARGKAEYEKEKQNEKQSTNFWDKVKGVGNVDLGGALTSAVNYGLGAYQIKEGKKGLQGERPIDKIDPTFQANVDTAQANAKFGFTPEQKFLLDQQNQSLLNQEMFAAEKYAGGSGGNAFNMSRSAANNAFTRSLQNAAANTELQQSKQQFAAQLAAQKAQMSRNIFEDSLRAFEQKQQAAGNLMATGISNILDTNRFANFMRLRGQENQFNNEYGV